MDYRSINLVTRVALFVLITSLVETGSSNDFAPEGEMPELSTRGMPIYGSGHPVQRSGGRRLVRDWLEISDA